MIHCEKITKYYGKHLALKEFSLHVNFGEIVGLLGVNGAGKSTLIKSILGFTQPTTGSIKLNIDSIGYTPEIASMPETISPLTFVHFSLRLRNANGQTAESCLADIKLAETAWRKPIRKLSKGMRQRTALAFALAGNPKLLILDEPMSGLDVLGRLQFIDLLKERHQQGAAILICSHIVPDLVRLSQRVILMNLGQTLNEFTLEKHDLHEVSLLETALTEGSKI